MSGEIWIRIGRVAKPHGLAGAVKVVGPWGFEGTFRRGDTLYLLADPEEGSLPARADASGLEAQPNHRKTSLRAFSRMGKFLILSLEDVQSREEAELLRGLELYGPESALD